MQESRASRADIQRLADRISAVFVPVVVSIAALTLLGWWLGGDPARGAISMVTVLIIACPCALGLATPMAVVVATGHAARRGILVRDAASLERAGRAERIVFDKTGTLTLGRPKVVSIEPVSGVGAAELLRVAASVEQSSEHPLARAIVEAAKERGLRLASVSSFESIPGQGVRGLVAGQRVEVRRAKEASCEVRVDDRPLGTIDLADEPRPDAAKAIAELRRLGLEISMLSGDRRVRAIEVAELVGIDPASVQAEVDPAGKLAFIEARARGSVMVGDGVNDAAALARAEVGLALASGTSVAIESAGIVVPGDRVLAVPETIRIARLALVTIRQNLFLAFAYNVSMIPIAAAGLLGVHGPLIAAAAMALSDLSVVGKRVAASSETASRGRSGRGDGARKGRVVGALAGEAVAVDMQHAPPMQEHGAGHLQRIADGMAHAVPCRGDRPHEVAQPEELAEGSSMQPGDPMESALRIGDSREVGSAEACEEGIPFSLAAHMHQDRRRPGGLDRVSLRDDVGDRLAAEGAAGVTKEDQEQRTFIRRLAKCSLAARA